MNKTNKIFYAGMIGIMLIGLILVSGCFGIVSGTEPVPTPNVNSLQGKINDLEKERASLEQKNNELINTNSTDTNKINELNNKVGELDKRITEYKNQIERAEQLDNSNWIYPAKINYLNYHASIVMTYVIRVHNGDNEQREFSILTEPYNDNDTAVAKTPNNIGEWITYQDVTSGKITLNGKEVKDIPATFCMPIEERFYSITDKGLKYQDSLILNASQKEIMNNFLKNTTVTKKVVEDNDWILNVNEFIKMGLVVPDNIFEFLTTFGASDGGFIQTRSAVRWTIKISEFSK